MCVTPNTNRLVHCHVRFNKYTGATAGAKHQLATLTDLQITGDPTIGTFHPGRVLLLIDGWKVVRVLDPVEKKEVGGIIG